MDDKKFMKLAINKTKEGMKQGHRPFGACIVKDDKVVCCAHNSVHDSEDSTAHAEVNAIRKACKKLDTVDLSGCVLYSTCEPCPMCFAAAHWANISKIVFGAKIQDAQKAGFDELTISNKEMKKLGKAKLKIVENILREENRELFKEWVKKKKRIEL